MESKKLMVNFEEKIETAFQKRDNILLMNELLKLDLFPIKDSYMAYLN
jgi:hypothetical protein